MKKPAISIDTASAITELSRRTWWRRVSAGEVTRVTPENPGRAMLWWDEIEPHLSIVLTLEEKDIVLLADDGNAEAQNHLGQLFLISEKHPSAYYWFLQAAQQNDPDAMQWLGHCYVNGKGVPKDENLGLMWIAKAAALGHAIAQGQMAGLLGNQPVK